MILLPLMALVLRLAGLRRCQCIFSLLYNPVRKTEPPESTLVRALHISRLVGLAVRHGGRPATCLQRSLALLWLLRRNGISSELHIGTRKEDGRLEAHAWIEIEGVVLNDSGDVRCRYEPFDREILPQLTGS
jgi:hypothetical protein